MAEENKLRWLDWIGRWQTVQAIIQSEFIRTILWPVIYAILTAVAGYWGNFPLMWVLVAVAVVFASVAHGILRSSEYRERKNPLNKLRYISTAVNYDLTQLPSPNRQQRRSGKIAQIVPRTLDKIQIGVHLRNEATFPISLYLDKADTAIETDDGDLKPPRSQYPKAATTILPGSSVMLTDDAILVNNQPCGNFSGKMDLIIKYGLPKREVYTLEFKAKIDAAMENFGFLTSTHTHWEKS